MGKGLPHPMLPKMPSGSSVQMPVPGRWGPQCPQNLGHTAAVGLEVKAEVVTDFTKVENVLNQPLLPFLIKLRNRCIV